MSGSAWHLYVIRTADGSLYTGIATDVERRVEEHESGRGRGAKALRGKGPLRLAYHCAVGDRATALRVEHALKRLAKDAKELLVRRRPTEKELVKLLCPPGTEPEGSARSEQGARS